MVGWEGWYLFSHVLTISYKFGEYGKTYIKIHEDKCFLYVREGARKYKFIFPGEGFDKTKGKNK